MSSALLWQVKAIEYDNYLPKMSKERIQSESLSSDVVLMDPTPVTHVCTVHTMGPVGPNTGDSHWSIYLDHPGAQLSTRINMRASELWFNLLQMYHKGQRTKATAHGSVGIHLYHGRQVSPKVQVSQIYRWKGSTSVAGSVFFVIMSFLCLRYDIAQWFQGFSHTVGTCGSYISFLRRSNIRFS